MSDFDPLFPRHDETDAETRRRLARLEEALARLCDALDATPCPPADHGCEEELTGYGSRGRCAIHYAAHVARQEIES